MVRKSKGRQKIEMVKMKNESNLQVTFSKRRAGLFKKASELCTLCDAEIGLIVFSPGGKVFSFGHPNVDTIIDRFMNNNPPPPHQHGNIQSGDAHRNSVIRELNDNLTKLLDGLELEKKKHEELTKIRENSKMAHNWWEDAVEGFNLSQCKEFKSALENLKKSVALEASKILQANPLQNLYVGSSSNDSFGVDGGISHFRPDFDMFGPRTMVDIQNNMTIPRFDGGSGSQANHGFGVDVGSSQNNPGFDMCDPRRTGNNGGSGSQANHGFGVEVRSSQNNPGFDMFDPRRTGNSQNMIVPHNPFIYNPNTILPHNTLQYGNTGNEGSVPDYNMNYGPGFNQNPSQMQLQVYNPNQNQNMMFKRENMSEYDGHHHGNPPHPRHDYY